MTTILHTIRCKVGEALRRAVAGLDGVAYFEALRVYWQHVRECDGCYTIQRTGERVE